VQRGWLANNVVRFFLKSGFDILAVVHPEEGLQSLEGLKCRVVRADITNPEQIKESAERCRSGGACCWSS